MEAASRTGDAPPHARAPTPAVTLDDIRAGARRRLRAGLLALPLGVALVVVGVWVLMASAPDGARWRVAAVGAVGQAALIAPRALRRWRLWRAVRRDVRTGDPVVPVRIAVYASGPLAALPAVVAIWPADDPHGAPHRIDAADRSGRPLVDGGRMWATVSGGPHRFATYRLEDGSPVVAAGRTNVLQRWQVRGHVRDLRRRGLLDRRTDAPYPQPDVAGRLGSEVRQALGPMAALAAAVALVGLLAVLQQPPRGLFGGLG